MAILEEVTRRALRPPLVPGKETAHGAEGGRGRTKPSNTNSYSRVSQRDTAKMNANSTVGQIGPRRRRKRIPKAIRQAVLELAGRLRSEFGAAFAGSRRLKRDVARLLAAQLPPQPGRPGGEAVTAAIRLCNDLRRTRPKKSDKEIWRQIYAALIPNHSRLPRIERRAAENQLHDQVRWRLIARRRRLRRDAAVKFAR